ncbi:hypothetical protein FBG13_09155 [Cobetia marina]|jgi:hypothetical protein|uniref:hypothetical protein n=1 Tax=Cobetia TaxID=204286 RepID=UPI000865A215|nr:MULTISPECIES: hypothetical protein [Cobetia]AOM00589.1 hypothetical protein BFX80_03850 [Cobetia marina]MDA5562479.1 hypothetical protein [Cobetia sp. MMG027]MDH2291143.1 hypothetical protein [Cobetia sp. 10Alg 146]MDN2656819.1 hypothetical protein [Cobetia sp. 14N.309.X.WAT.E.A4]POR07473.1 hypothetical protein BOH68_08010 [Cobetia sp. MM1IDA2H-1]
MTQTASLSPQQLARDIQQLEKRLHQIDPTEQPAQYRSLYCTISLRQMQLLAQNSQRVDSGHSLASGINR